MANPLTFLLPLRYDAVRAVLVVQSGPIDLAFAVARRLRALFPGAEVEALIREDDAEAVKPGAFERVTVVRWEDRLEVVRRLRQRRFDLVVVLSSVHGSPYLGLLPYLLRTRAIMVFNDHLDYFPIHVTRLAALALHVGGRGSAVGLLAWGAGRAVLVPLATVLLLASTGRLYLRAWRRARVRAG